MTISAGPQGDRIAMLESLIHVEFAALRTEVLTAAATQETHEPPTDPA